MPRNQRRFGLRSLPDRPNPCLARRPRRPRPHSLRSRAWSFGNKRELHPLSRIRAKPRYPDSTDNGLCKPAAPSRDRRSCPDSPPDPARRTPIENRPRPPTQRLLPQPRTRPISFVSCYSAPFATRTRPRFPNSGLMPFVAYTSGRSAAIAHRTIGSDVLSEKLELAARERESTWDLDFP
jgi:hypothetical protein